MTDGHDDDATEGREAVRVHFIQRLADAGLARPKGMTEAAYAEMQKGLVGWLAYMGAENLKTLAELIIDAAAATKGRCPSELVIKLEAQGLQKKPVTESRIFTSWLASFEGPKAQAGGYLVELYRFLRGTVPTRTPKDHDMRKIHAEAEANQRQRYHIRSRQARDCMTDEDRQWMAQWSADEQAANEIVAAGAPGRAARAKANGEAA